jgi:anti-sigma factor RsiW
MICPDRETALNALSDGELDAAAARALAAHVATCPGCAAGLAGLLALRAELAALAPAGPAPEALRQRVEASVAKAAARPGSRGRVPGRTAAARAARHGLAGFAAGLAVASVVAVTMIATRPSTHEAATLSALADSARRAALPVAALTPPGAAAPSPTVWFTRHGLAAPPAPDLAAAGFRFGSYRGDLVAGHRAAVLDYARAGHPVALFAWPPRPGEAAHPPRTARTQGMTVTYWNNGRTEFWVVGADPQAVAAFVAAYRAAM